MGRENALSRGREGNVHFGDRKLGIVGMVSMLPDMMVVSVGLATAYAMREEARCALSFFGDGATSRGDWHEAMNWAAVEGLPVIFFLEDNQVAYSTPRERQFVEHLAERAAAYGVSAVRVDGNDVEAIFTATAHARGRCLAGEGPTHNRHDLKLLEPTLDSIPIERPEPTRERPQGLCLDRGYDYAAARQAASTPGFVPHVRTRGEEIAEKIRVPGWRPRRWVVEAAHSWLNRNRGLLIRWSKKDENHLALLQLASGLIAFKKAHTARLAATLPA
jgi:hypothetical protein